jgi:3-dehydroquinate synthase
MAGEAGEARFTLTPAHPPAETEVRVGRGLLGRVSELLSEHVPAPAYAVIADETVADLYGEAVRDAIRGTGKDAWLFRFPPGESSKTLDRWGGLVESLGEAGLGRDGCVVAIGGGVAGDLGGFVAATYARGVRLVMVPTSLLAMIDAAIGGKTGVDLRAGKNLAGAFHDPSLVVVDPATLDSLPPQELRTGLAEAVKHGAIADAAYFASMEASAPEILALEPGPVDRLVSRSIAIKAAVVARDSREAGERASLNFGHTVAHGIERVTGYAVPHGQAVAMGLVAEARIGERVGITSPGTADRIEGLLRALELPVRIPGHVEPEAVLDAARSDKKARDGHVRYTLVAETGQVARTDEGGWTHGVADDDVAPVLVELGAQSRGGSAV